LRHSSSVWLAYLFTVIAVLTFVSVCATLNFVPTSEQHQRSGFIAQAKRALAPSVLAMLAIAMILIGGQFSAFTYMAPYLKEVTSASADSIGFYLLLYGAAGAAGMVAGGAFADRNAARTLIIANAMLVPCLASLYMFGTVPLATAVALTVWGFVSFALVPSLQLRVVSLAGEAADLAATLSASAVNVGIALGSLIGGWRSPAMV
jgi:DHA1 family inner membrane transport protein